MLSAARMGFWGRIAIVQCLSWLCDWIQPSWDLQPSVVLLVAVSKLFSDVSKPTCLLQAKFEKGSLQAETLSIGVYVYKYIQDYFQLYRTAFNLSPMFDI